VKIPTVCRHGDIADVNFILTNIGIVAVDFGFARFNEPLFGSRTDWFLLLKLDADARRLDILSIFDGVAPFFFAM
jgi:hypothetical protein